MSSHTRLIPALAASVIALASLAFAPAARAVVINFGASTDYTANFRQTYLDTGSSGALGYAASGPTLSGYAYGSGVVSHTSTGSGTAIFAYDTTPDGTPSNLFTNVTVEFDFSASATNTSFGIWFGSANRNTTSSSLALFNINNAAGDQLRFFSGAQQSSNNVGSVQTGFTQTLAAGGWTFGKIYHGKLEIVYTGATAATVTYTISDPYTASSPLTSFSATATGLAVAAAGGEIAFRSGFSASGTNNSFDNIQIYTAAAIPEPSAFAALGGLAALGFAAARRRARG